MCIAMTVAKTFMLCGYRIICAYRQSHVVQIQPEVLWSVLLTLSCVKDTKTHQGSESCKGQSWQQLNGHVFKVEEKLKEPSINHNVLMLRPK